MGDVITFNSSPPTVARQTYIEAGLSLGRADGLAMNLPAVLDAARASAWSPDEQENFPIIATVDPAARPDLVDAAALVVACDRLLADPAPQPRVSP